MTGMTNGIGTTHIGKANYMGNDEVEEEEFDTTLWFCLFLIPLIPLRSYRIRQKYWYHRKDLHFDEGGLGTKNYYHILRKQGLNWVQIFMTYLITFAGLSVLIGIILMICKYA